MKLLTDLKINTQRLVFRIKRRWKLARAEKRKREAVKESERLKNVTGKRHYVLMIEGEYVIKNSRQLKEVNKVLDRMAKINNVSLDKITVHTTK